MSFDKDIFEKYSIIGSFENQLRLSSAMGKSSKFNIESFLLESNQNMGWYSMLMENIKNDENEISKVETSSQNETDIKNQTITSQISDDNKTSLNENQKETNKITSTRSFNNKISKNYNFINKHWSEDNKFLSVMKHWYPFKLRLAQPRFSYLDSIQQKEYLEFNAKFKSSELIHHEPKNYKRFLHFKNLITKERDDFVEYLKKYFEAAKSEDYNFMDHEILRYTEEMIRLIENQALKCDRYFKLLEKITLYTDNTKAFLKIDKYLLNIGKPPSINVPNISSTALPSLEIMYQVINKRAPVARGSKKYLKTPISEDENAKKLAAKYQANFVMTLSTFENFLSQYQNEDELLVSFKVQEVTSNDGNTHKTIFVEKPFILKNLSKREKNEKFYKKSLICSFTKEQVLHNRRFIGKRKSTQQDETLKEIKETKNEDDEHYETRKKLHSEKFETDNFNYDLISTIETFGFGNIIQQRRNSEIEVNENKTEVSKSPMKSNLEVKEPEKNLECENDETKLEINEIHSSDDENQLIIDWPENNNNKKSNEIVSPEKKNKETIEEEILGPASPEHNLHLTSIDNKSNDNIILSTNPKVIPLENLEDDIKSDSSEKPKVPTLNDLMTKIHDRLLSASVANNQNIDKINHNTPITTFINSKKDQPCENSNEYTPIENIHYNINYSLWSFDHNFKVLIRWSHDGVILNENNMRENVVLIPKLEYQPQFGCEKISKREYCKMWTKSYIKNSSDILLCRINVYTNQLISATQINFNKLNEMLSIDCVFNPHIAMNHVFTLFNKLYSLQPANYLLSKQAKELNSYIIMKSTENKHNSFDLHFRCIGFDNLIEREPIWLPVDNEIFLSYHHMFNRIPCTFEPSKAEPKKKKQKKKKKKLN